MEKSDRLQGRLVRGWFRLALVVVCLIGVGACSTRTVYVAKEPGDAGAQGQETDGWRHVKDGTLLRALPGTPLNGTGQRDLTGLVLVNVWASYCQPCVKEMPLLETASRTGVVRVIGLSRDRYSKFATSATSKRGVTYPNSLDSEGRFVVALDGQIPLAAVPSSVMLRDGRVIATHVGELTSMSEIRAGVEMASR